MSVIQEHWLSVLGVRTDLLTDLPHEVEVVVLVGRLRCHEHGLLQTVANRTKDSDSKTSAWPGVVDDIILGGPRLGLHLPGVDCSLVHEDDRHIFVEKL